MADHLSEDIKQHKNTNCSSIFCAWFNGPTKKWQLFVVITFFAVINMTVYVYGIKPNNMPTVNIDDEYRTVEFDKSMLMEKILPDNFSNTMRLQQGNGFEDDEDLVSLRRKRQAQGNSGDGITEKPKNAKKKTAMMHLVPEPSNDIPFTRYYDFWKLDEDASNGLSENTFAQYREGVVKMKRRGIYLIYVQVSYQGRRTRYAYQINRNGNDISRCVVSEQHLEYSPHSAEHQSTETFTQCRTSIAVYLEKHDTISIKDLYNHVSSHGYSIKHQPENTYFGLVKLS